MPDQLTYSTKIIDFIKEFEGLYLYAYLDSVNVPTIGYGTTMYPDGSKVHIGDSCTEKVAVEWLMWEVDMKSKSVRHLIGAYPINQNQFDAFVSFTYNLGVGSLAESTLLKKFKIDPFDETIYKYKIDENHNPIADTCEFVRWCRAGKEIIRGLLRRRAAEADLYAA